MIQLLVAALGGLLMILGLGQLLNPLFHVHICSPFKSEVTAPRAAGLKTLPVKELEGVSRFQPHGKYIPLCPFRQRFYRQKCGVFPVCFGHNL